MKSLEQGKKKRLHIEKSFTKYQLHELKWPQPKYTIIMQFCNIRNRETGFPREKRKHTKTSDCVIVEFKHYRKKKKNLKYLWRIFLKLFTKTDLKN